MTVNRTTLLDLPLPVTGTESGTWGDTTNNGLTQYLDIAIAGTLVLSTDADVTLTSTEGDSSATNIGATTAQYAILRWTATGSTTRNITALAQSKTYVVINATGGTQSIVLRGAGPTTGVTIISGEKALCVWNGSDFVKVSSSAAAGGSNTQVQYNSSGVLAGSSNLTFDGTSLTLGGNPTLSAGSANGVLYLNGSKVATSGSALTFDGTNLGLGGAPTSYGSTTTLAITGTSYSEIDFKAGSTLQGHIAGGSSSLEIGTDGAFPLLFKINGSEQMRLTSTGLGIGTSSVTNPLTIVSATATTKLSSSTTTNQAYHSVTNASGNMYFGINNSANSFFAAAAYAGIVWHDGAYPIVFGTSNTERMRLDSSGNLGLGVTPSAWSTLRGLQNGRANLVGYVSNAEGAWLTNNAFYDGTGWKYQTTAQATMYQQLSGVQSWHTAPSGTAGNAITFTQAMTLDASGKLGIGRTSMTYPLDVQASDGNGIRFTDSNNSVQSFMGAVSSTGVFGTLSNHPTTFWTNNTERARITSGGDLLVGHTAVYSPVSNYKSVQINGVTGGIVDMGDGSGVYGRTSADVNGLNLEALGSRYTAFRTNGSERARIDSSGNLLVGRTSSDGYRLALSGATQKTSGVQFTYQGVQAASITVSSTSALVFGLDGSDGSTERARIDSSGNLIGAGTTSIIYWEGVYNNTTASAANMFVASNGSFARSTSSLKYKTDVQDAVHGLADVLKLRPVTYKGKSASDGDAVFGGLIAEEVHEAGLTEFVQYAEDGSPDALAYGNMVSLCIKAIQEQQALITSLTARVALLEGN